MDKIKDRTGNSLPLAGKIVIFIFIAFWSAGFFGGILSMFINPSGNSNNPKETDPGFVIDQYNVDLDVEEDNKVNVTETITITWVESGHHGIFKYIPEWLEYTNKDNRTIKRHSVISNLSSNRQFTTDVVNGKKRIKIGDPNAFASGTEDYVISYTYDMGSDPFKGYDEFIFHTFGDYWYPRINNFVITINMPKDIDTNKINLFKDKKRKTKAKNLDYYISKDGKTITISGTDYGLEQSLTVDIPLEEGYFEEGSYNYGYGSLIISLIIIGFMFLTIILWLIYGKDYPKEPAPVEFYSPDNLDPAEVGYIVGKQNGRKLIASLLVSLAAKGYISIDKKGEKNLEIKNLIFREGYERRMKVDLMKKIDINTSVEDQKLINKYFKEKEKGVAFYGDECAEFEEACASLIEKGVIQIKTDDLVKAKSNDIQMKLANELPELSKSETYLFKRLFSKGSETTDIASNKTFYKVYTEVADYLEKDFNKKLEEPVGRSLRTFVHIVAIFLVALWVISFFGIEDLAPKYQLLYWVSLGSLPITWIIGYIMTRRTKYGELISARVKGFKNYLATAEKAELEAQVEKNPNYFFDILPFAYTLHISKKWIKKFEKLNVKFPENVGDFDYRNIDSYDSFTSSVYYPSSSGSSSGGCSSCGGGCSSCGGGCSSCGGGGSW